MSDKNADFALEIRPENGDYKNGFIAEADLESGDFQVLTLRYKLPGGPDFNSLKDFDSEGTSTTCTVSRELLVKLFGKQPTFFAVATIGGVKKKSNDVFIDLT